MCIQTLLLSCEGRKIVFEKSSTQVKNIKAIGLLHFEKEKNKYQQALRYLKPTEQEVIIKSKKKIDEEYLS